MKKMLRLIGQGLAILAIGSVLFVVTLEVWTRAQPRRFFLEHDPELGFRLEPGAQGEYRGRFLLDANPDIRTPVSINSLGMRGPERSLEKPPGVRRLVILGDSFVQALEVPWEQTFYARLERRVEEAGAPPLETLPMAVTGYGQAQQLLWFERMGARLAPDLVLLSVFLGNDVTDNSVDFHMGATRPYFALADGELRLIETPHEAARWKYVAAKYLRSFILYREIGHRVAALRQLAARLGFVNYAWPQERIDRDSLRRKRRAAYDLTLALVERIVQSVRDAGAEPLVMIHGDYRTGSTRSPYALFSEFCSARGLRCLPLGPELGDDPELFVPEDEHWSAEGHRRVAEVLWSHWHEMLTAEGVP